MVHVCVTPHAVWAGQAARFVVLGPNWAPTTSSSPEPFENLERRARTIPSESALSQHHLEEIFYDKADHRP